MACAALTYTVACSVKSAGASAGVGLHERWSWCDGIVCVNLGSTVL